MFNRLLPLSFLIVIIVLGTTLVFYQLWNRLLNKRINGPGNKLIVIWSATIISTTLLISTLSFIPIFITKKMTEQFINMGLFRQITFTKEKWQENNYKRYEMVSDLLSSKICISKDTTEIKELLGEPSFRDSLSSRWIYYLGSPVRPFKSVKDKHDMHGNLNLLMLNLDSSTVTSVEYKFAPSPSH